MREQNIQMKYVSLQSLGYMICDVPLNIQEKTKKECVRLINSNFEDAVPYNYSLVGNIQHEYNLNCVTEELNDFLSVAVPEYFKFNHQHELANKKFKIQESDAELLGVGSKNTVMPSVWINFQQKHEYNPVHCHEGLLSFVYWVKIPYSLDNELKNPMTAYAFQKRAPAFSYFYSNCIPEMTSENTWGLVGSQIQQHTIPVDKYHEGKMVIFPAWLQHAVSPFFTSDEFRISVAGNIGMVKDA